MKKYKNYLLENNTNKIYYHGTNSDFTEFKLGQEINTNLYNSDIEDQGLGIFFTDNLEMANYFAGLIEFNPDTGKYVEIDNPTGRVIKVNLDIKDPWVLQDMIDEDEIDEDPGQTYLDIVEQQGGGSEFREFLIDASYDSVIVKNVETNYYGTNPNGFDIIVVLNPKSITIIE
jgi:hypothetical protein